METRNNDRQLQRVKERILRVYLVLEGDRGGLFFCGTRRRFWLATSATAQDKTLAAIQERQEAMNASTLSLYRVQRKHG